MTTTVREVIGIFFDVKHLEAAIKELRASGFQHDQGPSAKPGIFVL